MAELNSCSVSVRSETPACYADIDDEMYFLECVISKTGMYSFVIEEVDSMGTR